MHVAAHEVQELVHAQGVDAGPLAAHGLPEAVDEDEEVFAGRENVNEVGEVARQLLLVARLVGHPHCVVKAFPEFEAFGFREGRIAFEEGAKGGDGAVAGCAVWMAGLSDACTDTSGVFGHLLLDASCLMNGLEPCCAVVVAIFAV